MSHRGRDCGVYDTHFSTRSKEGRREEKKRVGELTVTRRFIVLEVCTADGCPHARNSEQRLRRAGRFSPTATWPLPLLSQLEREREREDRNPYTLPPSPNEVHKYKNMNINNYDVPDSTYKLGNHNYITL